MNRRDVTVQRASVVREPSAPIILWICAAVCAHFMLGEGGTVVAENHEAATYFAGLSAEARTIVSRANVVTEVEISPTDSSEDKKVDEQKQKDEVIVVKKDEEKKTEPPKPPTPPKPKPQEPEVKVAKKVVVEPEDPLKKLEEKKLLNKDDRIAVVQKTQKDQPDNDKARFIADEANTVEEEKVAKLTSHDRDDENPTPGGNHAGPQGEVGDSEKTKIAESEQHDGNKMRAPGEKGTEFDVQPMPMPTRPMGPVAVKGPDAKVPAATGGDGKPAGAVGEQKADKPELAPADRTQQTHEVLEGTAGNWSFNPMSPNPGTGVAKDPNAGTAPRDPKKLGSTQWMGLGGKPLPGQINLNLSHEGALATIGQDQLRKEREADGERRKSEHRGSFVASNLERWRSAIENYVTTVKPGNQTALNTARVPFATYLNHIHNRIHPIFADSFLDSLVGLPATHPLNDQKLATHLEIVLTKEGRIAKMGIAKSSGVTAFDIAALDAVDRAQPFGPAPTAILSTDGNVYLHWEFHRDEVFACSTANARPFMLNLPGPTPPTQPPARDPERENPRQERGAPPPVNVREHREGKLDSAPTPSKG